MRSIASAVLFEAGLRKTKMKVYGETLVDVARRNKNIVCLSADLTKQTEVDGFRSLIPERFFSMGMAEQNMIGVASGLAQGGYIPFVNSFCVFLSRRAYDQVAMSVAYPRMNVKLVGVMPGLSSPGGASHQAIDDLAIMRATPNMTVIDVGEATEAAMAVQAIAEFRGPVYFRLRRGELPHLFDESRYSFVIGESYLIREGGEAGLIASGLMTEKALQAHRLLLDQGIEVSVLHVPTIKPIDAAGIRYFAGHHPLLFTLDNHNVIGGLGSAVLEALSGTGITSNVTRIGLQDVYGQAATASYLYRKHGMEPDQIAAGVMRALTGTEASSRNAQPDSTNELKGWGETF